ncbi:MULTISPECIES: CcdB family protein [Providencia]|jgi:toxin CcdB|uniref:CcdB family protein n=1 Tax=Providencia TaxID=586 RepID=UPI001C5AE831|nr:MULTISPECIES: CcdB family protein [Providencia]ELR5151233.1 CcdB family protein [Providencia rettgeri]MDR2226668.1 CcdB family protein [Providencia sp.]QXX84748.1 CcdB family protein [Providencia sp. R33]
MQYHLYQNRGDAIRAPYLVDIQSDIIDILNTRLVIPLYDSDLLHQPVPDKLTPCLSILGHDYILMTHLMSAVPKSLLGKEIKNLSDERERIKKAIDLLIDGF